MIDLKDCIITRHSVRKYAEKKLSKEVILDLLETAVKAPTATNSQPWAFTIIQDIKSHYDSFLSYIHTSSYFHCHYISSP